MTRKSSLAWLLVLPFFLHPPLGLTQPLPPVEQWIPPEAVLVLELTQPEAVLDSLLNPKLAEVIKAHPAYQAQESNPKFREFQGVVKLFETQLQTDWQTGLRTLLGGTLTFAAGPTGETLLAVDSQDAQFLEKMHQLLLGIARSEAAKHDQPERVASAEYEGVTGWTFGTNEAHVILNNRLLLANRPHVLKYVLDLRADPDRPNLTGLGSYREAKKTVDKDAVGWAFLNLQALKENPPLKKALADSGNPLAALLFASAKEALFNANWLALGIYIKDDTLRLKLVSDGDRPDPNSPANFAVPSQPEEGVLANLSVPHGIAGISLYRDLHGFYAAKDDLFPERTSGLIFFENMMGIFFSGLDLTEEVLGKTKPEIRLVVAAQEYQDAVGIPQIQLPAFAAVFRLRNPEQFGEVVEEAWQKAIGLVNFTRGQKALPGLIIDRDSYLDTRYTVAYYRPPDDQKVGLHLRYNFRPTLARKGDSLILSSTDGLAKELIEALANPGAVSTKPLPQTHSLIEIDGAQLRQILEANRENMIRNNMVDKGNSKEQANVEVGFLLTLLDSLRQATLAMGRDNSHPTAQLALRLKLPSVEGVPAAPKATSARAPQAVTDREMFSQNR